MVLLLWGHEVSHALGPDALVEMGEEPEGEALAAESAVVDEKPELVAAVGEWALTLHELELGREDVGEKRLLLDGVPKPACRAQSIALAS